MSQNPTATLIEGNIYTIGTEEVIILSLDDDEVWVTYLNDPDRSEMVNRSALVR